MFFGWLQLGGVEIVNSARAWVYGTGGGAELVCEPCPNLRRALLDPPYTDPEGDDAPWFDPSQPESGRFYGVTGMGVEGLGASTAIRDPVPLVSGGALIGPQTHGMRELVWNVMLLAADDCSLAYGLAWLASALGGGSCVGCAGDVACVFTCCPPATPSPDGPGAGQLRQMFNSGLIEGPEVTERFTTAGAVGVRVEFTVGAGQPYLYRLPTLVAGNVQPEGQVYVSPRPEPPPECEASTDCIEDPECAAPPLPPQPPVPPDPCFGVDWYMARRSLVTVPPGLLPQWFEAVPIVTIRSGARAMRKVQVRFFANPKGLDCSESLDRCALCDVISVAYVPPHAELDIDGRTRQAWIDCTAGQRLAGGPPALYGPGGGAFTWPTIDCGNSLCIEVLASTENNRVEDWRVSIDMASREDLA